jgi:hypothetical protein
MNARGENLRLCFLKEGMDSPPAYGPCAPFHDPDVLDRIFASAFVIASARVVLLSAAVVLLFGGIYIAASTVHRMRRGQWLYRAGPFEAQLPEDAAEETEDVGNILESYVKVAKEKERLAGLLAKRDQQLERLFEAETTRRNLR